LTGAGDSWYINLMKKLLIGAAVAILLASGAKAQNSNSGHQPAIANFVVETIPAVVHPHEHFVYHVSFTASGNGEWQLWGSGITHVQTVLQNGAVHGSENLDLLVPGGDFDVDGLYIVATDKKGRTHIVLPQ